MMSLGALFDVLGAVFQLGTAAQDVAQIAKGPFRRENPAHRARVEALSRAHAESEARIASHLGTDLESPHIMHMTPPPSRQDGDRNDRA